MSPSSLRRYPTADLVAELSRRQGHLPALQRKRDRLIGQIRDIEIEIKKIERLAGRRVSEKPSRRRATLAATIVGFLSTTKPMTVDAITSAVQKSGYRSTAANLKRLVSRTLRTDKRFRQSGRGKYLLSKPRS